MEEENIDAYGAQFRRVRRESASYMGELVVKRDRGDGRGLKRVHPDDETVILATLPAGSGVRALTEDGVRRHVRERLSALYHSDMHFSSEAIKVLTVAANGYLNDLFALVARGTRLRKARVSSLQDFLLAESILTGDYSRLDRTFIDDELKDGQTLDIYSRRRPKRVRATDGAGDN